jgi:SAM-dependent methyltransferase
VFQTETLSAKLGKYANMNETDIQSFWNTHPCGDHLVGGLKEGAKGDYEAFFARYDAHRYAQEDHIPATLDGIDFAGKAVLDIGLGQGADAEQIIRRGALWHGLDLTAEAVERVGTRLALRNLPHRALKQGSALRIPYDDAQFDLVFSHGVLHHIPDILQAQREIRRVIKADGELVIMLYARWSVNYLLSIAVLRRLALILVYALGLKPRGIVGQHVENARQQGLWRYLRLDNFTHHNTDGPLNPYAKVYDLDAVRRDFPDFEIVKSYKRFMHAPPLPLAWLRPLAPLLGWHLWVHLKPKAR